MNSPISDIRFLSSSSDGLTACCTIRSESQIPSGQNDSHLPHHRGKEPALVRAAKAGDQSAFLELYRLCLPKVSRTAFRILRNSADVDDVVQECMMKAFSRLHQFDERAAFSTWVVRIGINDSLMVMRKRGKSRTESLDECIDDFGSRCLPEIPDASLSPEEHYVHSELVIRLREAVGKLPRSVRDVMELQQHNDASVREISNALNLSISAVKSRLCRGRKALRKVMDNATAHPPHIVARAQIQS